MSDGLKRGKRGGISGKNTSSDWAAYYEKHGHSSNFKKSWKNGSAEPPANPKDVTAQEEYRWAKEEEQRREYYESRGYDPDDEYADIDIALDAEDGPY